MGIGIKNLFIRPPTMDQLQQELDAEPRAAHNWLSAKDRRIAVDVIMHIHQPELPEFRCHRDSVCTQSATSGSPASEEGALPCVRAQRWIQVIPAGPV